MKTLLESELEKIKNGQLDGQTFNSDGSIWDRDGYLVDIVTLASVNIPQAELTADRLEAALEPFSELLEKRGIKAGVFSLGQGVVSVDINAVVSQKFRDNSVAFARTNNQVAIWDAVANEVVATGGNGETRLTDPDEIADAYRSLIRGIKVEFKKLV